MDHSQSLSLKSGKSSTLTYQNEGQIKTNRNNILKEKIWTEKDEKMSSTKKK